MTPAQDRSRSKPLVLDRIRPIIVLAILSAAVAALAPLQSLAIRCNWALARRLPVAFHRLALFLTGAKIEIRGAPPAPGTPTLVVANHVSWFDIPVLGSLAPLSFIAKSEVASWPGVGALAKLQRTVFVDRKRKSDTAKVNRNVAQRLTDGDSIVLFAEGTTGDGVRLQPFRSPILGAIREAASGVAANMIRLQPLAIRYARRNGLPISRHEFPEIAWYGDMDLVPHLKTFLNAGPLDILIAWGDPIPLDAASDRKQITRFLETEIRKALRTT